MILERIVRKRKINLHELHKAEKSATSRAGIRRMSAGTENMGVD